MLDAGRAVAAVVWRPLWAPDAVFKDDTYHRLVARGAERLHKHVR